MEIEQPTEAASAPEAAPSTPAPEPSPAPAENEGSIRDLLSSAFEASGEEPAEAREGAPASESGGPPRDEKGRFAAKAKDEAPAAPPPAEAKAAPPEPTPPTDTTEKAAPWKPPQSWRPAAREMLAKLSPEFKPIIEEVTRREGEIAKALQDSAEARKGYEQFRQTVAPYEQFIRSQGAEPVAAINGLLQTAVALRNGTVHERAELIANMIQNFLPGEEGVRALDERLTARFSGQPTPAHTPLRDPRVDDLLAQVEQAKRQRVEQVRAQAEADLAKFSESHEFYADVREPMGKLIQSGLAKDLEDAYALACKMNPEISGVIAQREAAKQAAKAVASTQRVRAAASSVRPSAGAVPPPPDPSDLRGVISAAFDAHSGR